MDDVVAVGQRARGRRRRRLAVAPRPPEPARAAENLVVGEHPERRHHEAAVERADGERGARTARAPSSSSSSSRSSWPSLSHRISVGGAPAEQRRAAGSGPGRPARAGRSRTAGPPARPAAAAGGTPRAARASARAPRRFLTRRHVLAQPASHLEMVLGLVPGALHLVPVGAGGFLDDDGVGREQLEQRRRTGGPSSRLAGGPVLGADRSDRRLPPSPAAAVTPSSSSRTAWVVIGRTVTSRSSCSERWVVRSNPRMRGDVVAPPFEPGRRGHAESVHVQNPAAHAELGHLGDRGHPPVAHPLERAAPPRRGAGARRRRAGAGAAPARPASESARPSPARSSPARGAVPAAAPRSSRPARRRSRSAARPRPAPRAADTARWPRRSGERDR